MRNPELIYLLKNERSKLIMEPMESPNFLEHAELLDENTPHYLNAFHKYLIQHNMSPNTITAYIYSVRHFFYILWTA